MKKFKLMLVAFMAMVGVNAFAQAPAPGNYSNSTFKYYFDGTGCEITGLQEDVKNTITEVAIPETVLVNGTEKPVTAIGTQAFKGITQITSVSIAKNVTQIKDEAFSGCINLATLDLSAATGLVVLRDYVFGSTPSLTSISFENCAKLVAFAFDATSSAAYNATLPGAVTTGSKYNATTTPTAAEITAVAATYASDAAITAAEAATYNATLYGAVAAASSFKPFIALGAKNNYLTSVTLNANTTEIGTAFADIPNLATLNISGTKLAALRALALDGNTKITSLELPKECASIEGTALQGTAVATLTINSVATTEQTIAASVYGTTANVLTSLTFKGVTKANIAAGAFTGSTKFTSLTFGELAAAAGTKIAGGAFVLAPKAASEVTIAKISGDAFAAADAITGPTETDIYADLTITDLSADLAYELIGNHVGTATIAAMNAAFSVTAVGNAQTIVFSAIKAATLFKAGTVTGTKKVIFGTETVGIDMAAGTVITASFAGAAAAETAFYWYPTTATKAFAADFIQNAAAGTAYGNATTTTMKCKLNTTTAVGAAYFAPADFTNDAEKINNVYIVASLPAAETKEIEVAKKDGNWYYGKFIAVGGIYSIDADDAVVYSAYVDGVNIYMDPLRIVDGQYVVAANEAVVIKNSTGDAVTATAVSDPAVVPTMRYDGTATIVNKIYWQGAGGLKAGDPKAVVGYEILDANVGKAVYAMAKPETYNLTWKKFKATTNLPAETIYVVTDVAAGDRLNIIWLDDSEEATAIKTVKSAKVENGAIFNLAGQKVNASYKGVVIKDGKKFIQK